MSDILAQLEAMKNGLGGDDADLVELAMAEIEQLRAVLRKSAEDVEQAVMAHGIQGKCATSFLLVCRGARMAADGVGDEDIAETMPPPPGR